MSGRIRLTRREAMHGMAGACWRRCCLGYGGKVTWVQNEQGLTVVMPEKKPCDYAITLKIV
jgi:hypothetical protein